MSERSFDMFKSIQTEKDLPKNLKQINILMIK